MSGTRLVIVGGGEGGARAAISLRQRGWKGAVTMLGEETRLPHERPPLSKSALIEASEPTPVWVAPLTQFERLDISLVLGAQAVEINRGARKVVTRAHGEFLYDRLILATGAAARGLNCEGGEHALTLRTFDDALALQQRLLAGSRLVVIGGGFIGLEVAASARKRGVVVTIVEAAIRVLSRAVPEDLARKLAERHAAEGVELRVGQALNRIVRDGGGFLVELASGQVIAADLVVAGVGSVPRTELAAAAGLDIDNGIALSGTLRTNDTCIFALGDCCSFPHPVYGERRIRLEAWRNVQDQADFLARSLMGESGVYEAIPWFWSDQYDLHLQIIGLPSEGSLRVRRDLGDGSVLDFHLTGEGRLVGASALGSIEKIGRDARIAEKLIASRATPDPAMLAKPGSKLKAMLLS